MLAEPEKENVFKFIFRQKHMLFEDDGITFRHEVERRRKRSITEKTRKKRKISPGQGGIVHQKPSGKG